MDKKFLRAFAANAYSAYTLSLRAELQNRLGPRLHEWFHTLMPGQLVMEISTIHFPKFDDKRLGYLLSAQREPSFSPEEWEAIKDEWGGEECPMVMTYRIRLLTTGEEQKWTNASFIRIAEQSDEGPALAVWAGHTPS